MSLDISCESDRSHEILTIFIPESQESNQRIFCLLHSLLSDIRITGQSR